MTQTTQQDRAHALCYARLCGVGGELVAVTIERATAIAQWLNTRPDYLTANDVMTDVATHAIRGTPTDQLISEATAIYTWLAKAPVTPEPEPA